MGKYLQAMESRLEKRIDVVMTSLGVDEEHIKACAASIRPTRHKEQKRKILENDESKAIRDEFKDLRSSRRKAPLTSHEGAESRIRKRIKEGMATESLTN